MAKSLFLGILVTIAQMCADYCAAADDAANQPQTISHARSLFLTGKYAEAGEAYDKLLKSEPVAAAIGLARVTEAQGKSDDAIQRLEKVVKEREKEPAIHAELARLKFERGDHEATAKLVEQALKLNADQPLARWIQAELYRTAGRLQDANAAYKWFVDFYNRQDRIDDPDTLRLIGRAAAQHARWNRLSDQYHFLVNELYPAILQLDEHYWPAHFEAGLLFLEKYNRGEAARSFNTALAINPNAAEAHAALAALALQDYELEQAKRHLDRALEINPNLLWARQLEADIRLASIDPHGAVELLEKARELNPKSDETLGRLAAALIGRDAMPEKIDEMPLGKLIDEVNQRNAHAGEFYNALGDGLDKLRRYPAAGKFYRETIDRMPQLVAPYGQLGLIEMRLADEAAAEKTLTKAFEVDPFNVRVNNTLKVLEILAGYATLETEHFVLKFDRAQDEMLAHTAAAYLEDDVYPRLVEKLGYEPKQKTLIEFFSRARNTDGHGWFSARMVGLPYVGTVGACAGRVVAMVSPNDGRTKFNWARILRHEFVHVVNLAQTDFAIPHWYTEALAVHYEDIPRPKEWEQVLRERAAEAKLFTLETINTGFSRPKTSADWALAYCQAELYAEYMIERFGDDALAKLLNAYAQNLATPAAIKRAFDIDVDEFERGYRERVDKLVAQRTVASDEKIETRAVLETKYNANPDDPDIAAQLALACLNENDIAIRKRARQLVDVILKQNPKHILANYVLAKLKLAAGEADEAIAVLERSLDREKPDRQTLALLAELKTKAGSEDALALYELGAEKYPGDLQWSRALARFYLTARDGNKLAPVLVRLANADPDNVTMRKKLALMAVDRQDHAETARWAREAIHIDANDAEMHRTLADALLAQKSHHRAAAAYQIAKLADPRDAGVRVGLVRALVADNQQVAARVELEAFEQLSPDHAEIEPLRELVGK
jgi:Tfp pilus assembly protein PilF